MDCVFCSIVTGELPATKSFESDELVAFNDIKPSARVHILIVPKVHITSVKELTESHAELVGNMVLAAKRIAQEQGLPGYKLAINVGKEGGQIVDHLHLHLMSPD